MCLYKSCYFIGFVATKEDLFWGFLLSLILKDIESKKFYDVVRDFLPITHNIVLQFQIHFDFQQKIGFLRHKK